MGVRGERGDVGSPHRSCRGACQILGERRSPHVGHCGADLSRRHVVIGISEGSRVAWNLKGFPVLTGPMVVLTKGKVKASPWTVCLWL